MLFLAFACRSAPEPVLDVGAIPDQDPERLGRLYGDLSAWLETETGYAVRYRPVTDYAATVTAFRVGDLDLVWFGGLTGVQARVEVPGAHAVAQRDVDTAFRSVFVAHRDAGLLPFDDVGGLSALRGRRFTFGSESSTSGRLMPEHFLRQAGLATTDFAGPPGFSGSHDKTLALVAAGAFEVGALNAQVWQAHVDRGDPDLAQVVLLFTTPTYADYHWVLNPAVEAELGAGASDRITKALLALDGSDDDERAILGLFGAERFVPARDEDYAPIEQIARELGRIR